MMNVEEEQMDFESELNKQVGQFGKSQFINLVLIAIPCMVSGFMAGDYVFTASRLPHRCAVLGCENATEEFTPNWIANAIPALNSGGYADCQRYANISAIPEPIIGQETCPVYLFNTSNVVQCESYIYQRTNSVVYDFGLECQEWLRALAGTMNSLGGMVVLPIAGFVSDYFGRRTSIIIFSFNIALVGVIRSFSVNYPMYVALQFLQTALGGGAYSAGYILAAEIVGPKYRVATSATMSSMFAVGQMVLGLVASAVYGWRTLSRVLFIPIFILVSYRWILTESHRWLISKNKPKQARAVLVQAATMNGRRVSEKSINFLLNAIPQTNKNRNTESGDRNLIARVIDSSVILKRCCTTPVWWITTTFIYYGLSINSVSLSGNMYINYVAAVAVEIPGYWTAVLVLDRVGRRPTLFVSYMSCAVCCIAFAFIPNAYPGLSMFVYLTGKFSIAVVFTSLYLYTSELYPTRHRHSFLAFSSMLGRVGSVVAPLTPPLMDYWEGIPSMMFGTMAVISAALILTQPETWGKKLPNTFEDAEDL